MNSRLYAPPVSETPLSVGDAATIRRILKVNHAGEHGAIRIYRAQVFVARKTMPDIAPILTAMLDHEIRHHDMFLKSMPSRGARPCRVMSLWSMGGGALGLLTGLLGRRAVWVCTEAVEETVHRHLEDQLRFLQDRDKALHMAISEILTEELAHLNTARAHITFRTMADRWLSRMIALATEGVIWLSTWGDSTRMFRELERAHLG